MTSGGHDATAGLPSTDDRTVGTGPLTWGRRLLPLVFFVVYLTGTVLLFAYGPWPWPVDHPLKLYGFLAAAHAALIAGYVSAAGSTPRSYRGVWRFDRMLLLSIAVNLVLLLPTSKSRTGSLVPNILSGALDPGQAYAAAYELQGEGVGVVEYVRYVAAPLLYAVFPLTVFYWSAIRPWLRYAAVVSMLGFAAVFVAMGTNKALADYVTVGPWLVTAAAMAGMIRVRFRTLLAFGVAGLVGLALFLSFFTIGQVGRPGMAALAGYFSGARISYDRNNALIRDLPLPAQLGATALSVYVTQGYYALGLSLDETFEPMYGVGNSMFLSRNAAKVLGDESLPSRSLPARIEYRGWDAYQYWSSIYPWIASDVGFPGTLVFVFVIGRLLALTWLDTVGTRNPLAVLVFAQLVTMLYYFPANNQIGQGGEALIAFIVWLVCWKLQRSRTPFYRRMTAQAGNTGSPRTPRQTLR